MAEVIYVLCGLTSAACAALLLRAYSDKGVRLLFWSGLCFLGLAANNVLLFADLVIFPTAIDLAVPRGLAALAAMTLLVIGLVSEEDA
jgi:hypothetical protein